MSHEKEEYDHVPTPTWLLEIFDGWFDPYPLSGKKREPAEDNAKIFANPGYSRKEDAIKDCIRWHQAGYFVVLLIPNESSTTYAKPLLQYGVERMYFDHRIFPGCRNVELFILTGSPRKQHLIEATASDSAGDTK